MMVYGIIAALDEELAPLLKIAQITRQQEVYGTLIHCGTLYGKDVVLCKCGIATINAALCASTLIREYGVQALINTGIAGALGAGVHTLDVVLSDEAVYHDRDSEIMKKYFPFTVSFRADPTLLASALEASKNVKGPNGDTIHTHVGRVATGDRFVSDAQMKRAIIEAVHPLCVEMEGAAIANAAYNNGCPFVIIRTMSDNADEVADESYDTLIEDASAISASIVLKMMEE